MLINNAGLAVISLFDELTDLNLFQHAIDVNFYGAVNCTYFVLPFIKQTRGRIVAISSYEDLIKKVNAVNHYPVIWQAYNHPMPQAADFARRLFPLSNLEAGEYPASILHTIERLHTAGIPNWESLLNKIPDRASCMGFVTEHGLVFYELIDLLNYLLRWAFPFQTASRELLDHDHFQEMKHYEILKRHQLMNSFDLLEQGHTLAARHQMVERSGLPLEFITAIVHRADIARLPFVRRKTILAVCGAGYGSLEKIAQAALPQMETDMDSNFRRTQGKPWKNFKSVIVLEGLVTSAQALPVIVEA